MIPPAAKLIVVKNIHVPLIVGPRTKDSILTYLESIGLELNWKDDFVEVYQKPGIEFNGISTIFYENFQGIVLEPIHLDGNIPKL